MCHLFKQFDIDNKGKVDLECYKQALKKNKDLIEIFNFLCRGISNSVNNKEKQFEIQVLENLSNIENQVETIISTIRENKYNNNIENLIENNNKEEFLTSSIDKENVINEINQNNSIANFIIKQSKIYVQKSISQSIIFLIV